MSHPRALAHAQRLPDGQRAIFLSEWNRRSKDKTTALLLSLLWLIGIAGVGRMYIGQVGQGVAQLFLSPMTCFIWSFVDIFLIGDACDQVNAMTLAELEITYPAR